MLIIWKCYEGRNRLCEFLCQNLCSNFSKRLFFSHETSLQMINVEKSCTTLFQSCYLLLEEVNFITNSRSFLLMLQKISSTKSASLVFGSIHVLYWDFCIIDTEGYFYLHTPSGTKALFSLSSPQHPTHTFNMDRDKYRVFHRNKRLIIIYSDSNPTVPLELWF